MSLAEAARLEAIALSLEQEAHQLRALAQEFRDALAASNDAKAAKPTDGKADKDTSRLTLADSTTTNLSLPENSHGLGNASASASTAGRLPEAENHSESLRKATPVKTIESLKRSEPAGETAASPEKSHERPPKRRVTVSRASENVDDKGPAPTGKARKDVSLAGAAVENVNDSVKSKADSSGKMTDGSAATSSSEHSNWACEACTLENSGCVRESEPSSLFGVCASTATALATHNAIPPFLNVVFSTSLTLPRLLSLLLLLLLRPATKCACCGTVRKALSERPSRMTSPQLREV